jgi:hypothetical protein
LTGINKEESASLLVFTRAVKKGTSYDKTKKQIIKKRDLKRSIEPRRIDFIKPYPSQKRESQVLG